MSLGLGAEAKTRSGAGIFFFWAGELEHGLEMGLESGLGLGFGTELELELELGIEFRSDT